MEAHEYPVRHFELMVRLAVELRALPAQILEHEYHYGAFGSWCTHLRFRGKPFRLVFDGRERELTLERASTSVEPFQWEVLASYPTADHETEARVAEAVARLAQVV